MQKQNPLEQREPVDAEQYRDLILENLRLTEQMSKAGKILFGESAPKVADAMLKLIEEFRMTGEEVAVFIDLVQMNTEVAKETEAMAGLVAGLARASTSDTSGSRNLAKEAIRRVAAGEGAPGVFYKADTSRGEDYPPELQDAIDDARHDIAEGPYKGLIHDVLTERAQHDWSRMGEERRAKAEHRAKNRGGGSAGLAGA